MLGFDLLHLKQPKTKRPVYEFSVTNRFGVWMRNRGWAGLTLPLGLFVVVLYWNPQPDLPLTRVHEFQHVAQSELPGSFWLRYFWAMWRGRGYNGNAMEHEAYDAEDLANKDGLPDWAK